MELREGCDDIVMVLAERVAPLANPTRDALRERKVSGMQICENLDPGPLVCSKGTATAIATEVGLDGAPDRAVDPARARVTIGVSRRRRERASEYTVKVGKGALSAKGGVHGG